MKINLGKLLTGIVQAVPNLIGLLKGKPSTEEALAFAFTNAIALYNKAASEGQLDTLEGIRAWRESLDQISGAEGTAIDLVPTLPSDVEERFTDSLLDCLVILACNRAKVPGFFVQP